MIARRICSGRALRRYSIQTCCPPARSALGSADGRHQRHRSLNRADPPEQDVSAEEIIAGMKQIIDRVHAHGVKIYGATLTPYEDTVFHGYYSRRAKRSAKR